MTSVLLPRCKTQIMMKFLPLRPFYAGSSVTCLAYLKQTPVCGEGRVTIRHEDNLDIVNTNVYERCRANIQRDRYSGLYLGTPINRLVVCGHGLGEFTRCHIRSFSAVSSSSSSSEGNGHMAWEELVDYSRLSPQEMEIHECHKKAVMENQLLYTDPLTGYQVMSRYAHLKRGDCCGNACRHCPYQHQRVADDANKMIFNSAFYVGSGEFQET